MMIDDEKKEQESAEAISGLKILWMVLQMIEAQTLTTFLFIDTDENGELSLQELSVFIKSEY